MVYLTILRTLLRQFVPKFDEVAPRTEPRGTLPRLSVLIPACNEATTIERALRTLLKQDYPHLEVVVVNDRSEDDTGAILIVLQGKILAFELCTRSFTRWVVGKVYALKMAAEQASGEWLLCSGRGHSFCERLFEKGCVVCRARVVGSFIASAHDDLTFYLGAIQHRLCYAGILLAVKPWHVNDTQRPEGLGVGAFNMVRRVAFEDTMGFEWFKMDVADDVALGQMMKNATGRSHILIANDAS